MHPGWAAQIGLSRGAPGAGRLRRTSHGASRASTACSTPSRNTDDGDFEAMLDASERNGSGSRSPSSPTPAERWRIRTSTAHARCEQAGIDAAPIDRIECETAEGIVHRLWEPLDRKQRAAQRLRGQVQHSLRDRGRLFERRRRSGRVTTTRWSHDADAAALASKVNYRRRSGQSVSRALHRPSPGDCSTTGAVLEHRQDYFRGGADDPLSDAAIDDEILRQLRLRRHDGAGRAPRRGHCARAARTEGESVSRALDGERRQPERDRPVALVTGASRNIGRRIALALAAGGPCRRRQCAQSQDDGAEAVVDESARRRACPAVSPPTSPTRPRCAPWSRRVGGALGPARRRWSTTPRCGGRRPLDADLDRPTGTDTLRSCSTAPSSAPGRTAAAGARAQPRPSSTSAA